MNDMLGKKRKDDRHYSRNPIPYTGSHGMSKGVLLVFLLVLGIAAFSHGLSTRAISIFLIASALVLMAYYFESRPRDKPPSRTERVAAFLWRAFRTVVGLLGAFVLIGAPITAVISGKQSLERYQDAILLGTLILMGLACIWWGLIGHAFDGMRRDLDVHRENKQRYKWRF